MPCAERQDMSGSQHKTCLVLRHTTRELVLRHITCLALKQKTCLVLGLVTCLVLRHKTCFEQDATQDMSSVETQDMSCVETQRKTCLVLGRETSLVLRHQTCLALRNKTSTCPKPQNRAPTARRRLRLSQDGATSLRNVSKYFPDIQDIILRQIMTAKV